MLRSLKRILFIASIWSATALHGVALDVAREDTLIFDTDRPIATSQSYNWLADDINRQHGAHQLMWEPLFILNYEAGQIEPWLATDFASNEDATEWTINLRGGVEWSDGEVFDANDVLFTINSALNNASLNALEAARIRAQVQSVEAKSPTQLVFTLKQGNPRFIVENFAVQHFSSFLIMPEHVWGDEDLESFTFKQPIGTGPYTLTETIEGRAVWDRNDNWWGAKTGFMDLPEPKRVVYVSSSSAEERLARIASNEIDAAHSVSFKQFKEISAENPNVIVWREEAPFSWFGPCGWQLDFNTNNAPWDAKELRNAVSLLIDRAQLAKTAFDGKTIPSRTIFVEHGGMFPFIEALEDAGLSTSVNAQIKTAAALLDAGGWHKSAEGFFEKDGEPLTASILFDASSNSGKLGVKEIVDQLSAAGIKTDPVSVANSKAFAERMRNDDFNIAFHNQTCGSINEPWTSMQRYSGVLSSSKAEKFNDLIDELGSLKLWDPAAMKPMISAYEILVDEVPFTPVVQDPVLLPYNQTYWVNWPQEYNNFNHPAFWWGSAHQIIHTLQKPL
ncbi:MAG: ABC transporter substrate-binding protein [Pseudomonadota bacterium]